MTGPFIIGLTGGIASGKSSICKRLNKLGAFTVDCDKVWITPSQCSSDAVDS